MLQIDLPLVILTAVVFLGLIAVLNSVLYKPMLKFIDDRNASIKSDEDSVSKNTSDLSIHEKEIEAIILKARSDANKIKQDALDLARANSLKEVNDKKESLAKEYEMFLQKLDTQKSELQQNLAKTLPELRVAINSKLAKI